jgi:hypothetical protein
MYDPERLLSGGASDDELTLLRAGADDEPPSEGAQRVARALGVALPASVAVPSADAPTVLAGAGKSALKWLLVAGGGVALVGSLLVVGPALRDRTSERAAEQTRSAGPAQPRASAERAAEAVEVAHPQAGTPAGATPSSPGASTRAHAARGGELAREIERLDRARTALRRGELTRANAALSEYEHQHERGELREEASFLRFETLVATRDREAAREHARSFLRAYPVSVHARRVRSWLGERDHAP